MSLADKILYRLFPITSQGNLDVLLDTLAKQVKNVSFVQVGAHDGRSGDLINGYLAQYPWRGVLVEPVPYLYERLVDNYIQFSDRLAFENVAIDSYPGVKKFYAIHEVEKGGAPRWHTQLGSFDKGNILKHSDSIPGLESMIYEMEVRTMTMRGLLEKHALHDPHLIVIDTEGYDGVIVKNLLDEGIRPRILIFEHKHLGWWNYGSCVRRLRSLDYEVCREGGNSLAILRG